MLYYLAGVSVVGTIGFGLFYLYDERTATAIMEAYADPNLKKSPILILAFLIRFF